MSERTDKAREVLKGSTREVRKVGTEAVDKALEISATSAFQEAANKGLKVGGAAAAVGIVLGAVTFLPVLATAFVGAAVGVGIGIEKFSTLKKAEKAEEASKFELNI